MADAGCATDARTVTLPWEWAGRAACAALLVGAAVVMGSQVQVRTTGMPALSCGSSWDVVAGRSGWPQWFSADLSDPAQGGRPPVRTVRCPAAVNRRTAWAGALAVVAISTASAGEVLGRRRRPRPSAQGTARRLRAFGTVLTIIGSLLGAGGLIGLALLVADPRSTLFLYVSRSVVVLAGLLLVLPAVLLVALGRAAALSADHLAGGETGSARP